MVIDHISNIGRYCKLHNKCFQDVIEYLEENNIKNFPVGRQDIIKDCAYVSIDKTLAGNAEDSYLEAHRKYIDIQIIFSGIDSMGWKPVSLCTEIQSEYSEERDIIFYKNKPDFFVPVLPSFFTVFTPEDAHMPLIGTGRIHKAVIKVKIT